MSSVYTNQSSLALRYAADIFSGIRRCIPPSNCRFSRIGYSWFSSACTGRSRLCHFIFLRQVIYYVIQAEFHNTVFVITNCVNGILILRYSNIFCQDLEYCVRLKIIDYWPLRMVRTTYRTGVPLPSKFCILCIFSTSISTEYFKHAAHSPFFSSKCHLFHNASFFGSCIIHILLTGCGKI
jgi:hypothetical protein